MFKLLSQLLASLAGAFALALFITLNVYLTPFLGAWMFLVDAVFLFSGLALFSYLADTSIPLLRIILRRSYYRAKFKQGKLKDISRIRLAYLKVLASLIVLFKSAEDGFEVIKEEAHLIHGKTILFLDKERKKSAELTKQLLGIHKTKQRRSAVISATAIMLFVMGSVLTAIFSSIMYPNIFQSQAATYTWTQTDWSGGTSTAVAVHDSVTGPPANWTNYLSADSNIVIDGGNITMGTGVQDVIETDDDDFNNGSFLGDDPRSIGGISGGAISLGIGGIYPECISNGRVLGEDYVVSGYTWTQCNNYCRNLCPTCRPITTSEICCVGSSSRLGGSVGRAFWLAPSICGIGNCGSNCGQMCYNDWTGDYFCSSPDCACAFTY